MKITNKLSLPKAIVDAVINSARKYDRGDSDYSVTQLLKPPRIVALEAMHEADIEEDASDRIWSLVGQLMHQLIELSGTEGQIEHRLFTTLAGKRISGQLDLFQDGIIKDWKFVTAWKFKDGSVPREFCEQLNCYACLARMNGYPVNGLQIIAIYRDWSKLESARNDKYPKTQIEVHNVAMWPEAEAKAFLEGRINAHEMAKTTLPTCSPEDRWQKPEQFAVKKVGAKRATKLYDSRDEAFIHASQDPSLEVERRPGSCPRCDSYCAISKWCSQYQNEDTNKKENGK